MHQLFRLIIIAAVIATANTATMAQDYASYYQNLPVELRQVAVPEIPENTVNITDFDGKGDAVTLNTEAFAQAINALSKKGGGHLIVPAGIWLTASIQLKDNIDLHLERNAVIYFSPDKSLFVDKSGKTSRALSGIRASKRKNISITGEGIIDGNGAQWRPVKRSKVSDVEWKQLTSIGGVERADGSLWYPWDDKSGYPNIASSPEEQESMRNDVIRLTNCENIMIQGVTIQNSPKFHVHPINCRNVILDGITVRCPWNAQNGDAIDLSDCHVALIVNCTVDAGDDGLCMKSGNHKESNLVNGCEDILLQDNTVFHAHGGFVVGSENICGMKRIVVRNCRMAGTDTGLRFKSGIGRGGKTEDIYISNIVMSDISGEAVIFQCDYVNRPAGSEDATNENAKDLVNVPEFTDVHIDNVICRGAKIAISAHGIENLNCVHDIEIRNSTFVYTKKSTDIDTTTAQLTLTDVTLKSIAKEQ